MPSTFGHTNSTQPSFLRAFAWNHAARTLEYVFMYLFSLIVARFLGPELNGTYALFLSIVQFLLICSSLGLETSLASYVPRLLKESTKETVAQTLRQLLIVRLLIGVAVGIVLYILGDVVQRLLNAPPLFLELLFLLVFYFLCRNIVVLLSSFQIARYETHVVGIITISVRLVEVVGAFGIIFLGGGFREVWMLLSATNFLQVIFLVFSLRDFIRLTSSSSQATPVLVSGVKFWLNSIMEFALGRQADILLLGYFLVGTVAIGYYDVALGFAQVINFGMAGGLYGLSIASFSSVATADKESLRRHFEFLSSAIVMIIIPVFVFATAFASTIIPLLYSPKYSSSVLLFQSISIFVMLTRFLGGGIASDYLQASRNMKALFIGSGISGIVNVTLAIVLIPKYGTIGAVFATGISLLIITGIQAMFVQRDLQVRFPVSLASWICLIGGVSAILANEFSSGMGSDNLILKLLLYLFFFVIGCLVVRPLSSEFSDYLRGLHPLLARLLRPFVAVPVEEAFESLMPTLTDRQKWAFAWLPQCDVAVDVGSSATPLSWYLKQKSKVGIVTDVDTQALEELRYLQVDVIPIASSAEHLPFVNESVNTVLLLDVLEHVRNDQKVIDEAWRILSKGGTLILSVPHKGLFQWLDPQNLSARLRGKFDARNYHRHYSEEDLKMLMIPKFTIRRKHFGGLFLYPLSFAAHNFVKKYFKQDWGKFFKKLGDIDNDLSWGKWSYNVIILAEKEIVR